MSVIQDLTARVEAIEKSLRKSPKMAESIIYFKRFEECSRAIRYLLQKNMPIDLRGCGIIITSESAIDSLSGENYNFSRAKSLREIYDSNPNFVRDYADQVRAHHKLPSWKRTHASEQASP